MIAVQVLLWSTSSTHLLHFTDSIKSCVVDLDIALRVLALHCSLFTFVSGQVIKVVPRLSVLFIPATARPNHNHGLYLNPTCECHHGRSQR